MPRISEWSPGEPVQVLVYGKSKSGKTEGAGTFPRPVFLDFDDGCATLRSPGFIARHGFRDAFYETFKERNIKDGIVLTHNAFDDACRFFDEWMKPTGKWTTGDKTYDIGRDQFDTWIIDSGTTLVEFASHKAIIIMGGRGSKAFEKGKSSGLIAMEQGDWGAERSLTEQFISMVKDSGKNVVLICHERMYENKKEGITQIVPMLTGQSVEKVPLKFDEVYNLRVRPDGLTTKRYLQTVTDGMRIAGSRYGVPNESSWTWEAVHGALQAIHAQQQTTQPEATSNVPTHSA